MIKLAFAVLSCSAALCVAGQPALQHKGPGQQLPSRDAVRGKRLFIAHCAHCHGIDGRGGRGPNLAQRVLSRAPDKKALFQLIRDGVDGGEMPGFWQLSDNEVWRVVAFVRSLGAVPRVPLPGDASRGKQIYEAMGGCASCHIVKGQGTGYGPELTRVGAIRSAAYLRESLIHADAAVPEGFLMVRVRTQDGTEISGQRVNEDSFTIQIRDAKNQFHSFRKLSLTSLQKEFGKSPMPSYERSLSSAEIDDVVAYLASLRNDK
jgi:putative heme-binding domain-containing protein